MGEGEGGGSHYANLCVYLQGYNVPNFVPIMFPHNPPNFSSICSELLTPRTSSF